MQNAKSQIRAFLDSLLRRDRFYVIKRLGAGFWSDVDHVVAQLAVAEILGRTPMVMWGTSGPYGDRKSETFTLYFRPVSEATPSDIKGQIFPPAWNPTNFFDDLPFPATGYIDPAYGNYFLSVEKKDVPASERTLTAMLSRSEPVIVAMCHEPLSSIEAAAPARSRFKGMSPEQMRRVIVGERLKLQPHLQEEVARFRVSHFGGKPVLAVHLRGSDKVVENAALHEQNEQAIAEAGKWLDSPDHLVFLLTDSEHYKARLQGLFGSRVVSQDCLRTQSEVVPNYLMTDSDGYRNGREIILDTYVAASCRRFVGNYSSNVARYVAALGTFGPDEIRFTDQI